MPASTEQKVDFLLKKIGYSASKTGGVEGSSGTVDGTKKKPSEEAIPSPLIIPSTNIWADSSLIPATPPGSDTFPVKVYATASAYRLTADNTVSESRSFIARSTYGNVSSSIDGNWIDSQFGADYAVRVFKGDPNSGGLELSQAGATGNDTWFFDYSSGILNFNGTDNHSTLGVTDTNIYILGYRYTGGIGAKPVTGIGTFSSLHVSGIATFKDDVEFHGVSGITSVSFDKSDNSFKFVDGAKLKIGNSNEYEMYYKPDTDEIRVGIKTGNNYVLMGDVIDIKDASGDTHFIIARGNLDGNNYVELLHNDNRRLITTGYGVSVTGLEVTGISTLTGDVRAGANLSVAGLSTFTQLVDINGGGQANTFKVEDLTQYSVVLAGAGGELQDDSKLTFDANSNLNVTGGLVVSGITTLGSVGISTGLISGPATMYIDPATVGDNTGLLVVKGNLQVDGTQTTVNSATMTVTDKNIEIAKGAANDAAADGAGITIDSGDGDKTLNWVDATDAWTSSEHIQVAAGKQLGFADDTNTYIDRPAADNIRFTTGASVAVTIDENQRLGIGTDNPQALLHVYDDAAAVYTKIESTSGAATLDLRQTNKYGSLNYYYQGTHKWLFGQVNQESDISLYQPTGVASGEEPYRIVVKASGNIGIHSTTPTTTLDVRGTVQVSGISTFSDDVTIVDGKKILLGDSDDLQIWHDNAGGHSRIDDTGTGNLVLRGASGILLEKYGGGYMANFINDGSVDLYYAASKKFETLQRGVGIGGSIHIDNDAYVTGITTTVQLKVGANPTVGITTILDEDNMASDSATALATQQSIKAYVDTNITAQDLDFAGDGGTGAVDLDSQSLTIAGTSNEIETSASGQTLTVGLPNDVTIANDLTVASHAGIGSLSVTGVSTFSDHVSVANTKEIRFGSNDELKLSNNGNSAYVQHSGSGYLFIHGNDIALRSVSQKNYIVCDSDEEVSLYYNNAKKFETLERGVGIGGSIHIDNDLYVTGVSTFTGNIDANGDLDVDGQTEVDDINVAGVSTFVGVATFTSNDVYIDNKLFVGGIEIAPGAAITSPNLDINDYIRHNGDLTTKFGFPTDGKVVTNISGTERTRITSAGTYTTGIATATGVINSETDVQINGTSVLTSALNEAVAMAIALG